jgi:hypothetical protein
VAVEAVVTSVVAGWLSCVAMLLVAVSAPDNAVRPKAGLKDSA